MLTDNGCAWWLLKPSDAMLRLNVLLGLASPEPTKSRAASHLRRDTLLQAKCERDLQYLSFGLPWHPQAGVGAVRGESKNFQDCPT